MSKLNELKEAILRLLEKIRDSEVYQQLKSKYENLDSDRKLYLNIAVVCVLVGGVLFTIFAGIAKVNSLKSDIHEKEELVGYLQQSSSTIQQLKAQQQATRSSVDLNATLNQFIESVISSVGLDQSKVEVSQEKPGQEEKEVREVLVDVKITHTNLRQLSKVLFQITDQGAFRNTTVKNLDIDTKNDPQGYMDATLTVSSYKAK